MVVVALPDGFRHGAFVVSWTAVGYVEIVLFGFAFRDVVALAYQNQQTHLSFSRALGRERAGVRTFRRYHFI